ncbi:MAG TPA: hypothetical protein VLG50_08085 [Candidatus Saccharimonadales bacterium]|nr:hypothetical protein [Candidatus Saccharimonadales bacterium]
MEQTIPIILEQLRYTQEYKNLSDYYIKNDIKLKYNLKTVKKVDLILALKDTKDAKSTTEQVNIPEEIVGEIASYLPITKSRAINKQYLKSYQQQWENLKKDFFIVLNTICPYYLSGRGFNWEPEIFKEKDDIDFDKVIQLGAKIFDSDTLKKIEKASDLEDYVEYLIKFDNKILHELAQITVPYSTIIIKYIEDTWYEKPKQWYNDKTKTKLPLLKTKKYIKVDNPFMSVTISQSLKGSRINIEDILFASVALAVDKTRTVDKYDIISDVNGILTLEPDIDNYST